MKWIGYSFTKSLLSKVNEVGRESTGILLAIIFFFRKDLFDDFFVQKGLDELIPITENDFNNFTDTIYDKTYTPGYLIYLDGYYIFQPFDKSDNLATNINPLFEAVFFKPIYHVKKVLNAK